MIDVAVSEESDFTSNLLKQNTWVDIQQQISCRVCVPRTDGLVEQYTENEGNESISLTSTFVLPQELLMEPYTSTVLGPQLLRDAQRRITSFFSTHSPLRYVGGVDISFLKGTYIAVACLVIMEYPSMRRLRTFFHQCEVRERYTPGFLAFREAAPLATVLRKAMDELRECKQQENKEDGVVSFPQVLLVDGCGVYHPLRCGLASHLGVLLKIPTIGCAKNFMAVDGLSRETMSRLFATTIENETTNKDEKKNIKRSTAAASVVVKPIIGPQSGMLFGYAVTPNCSVKKPIFISPGHCIGYAEATALVISMCKYRVPEPIRAADLSSREYIQRTALGIGVVT